MYKMEEKNNIFIKIDCEGLLSRENALTVRNALC